MHEFYLKEALLQAETRRGFCAPNPSVGAVVVKDNIMLAKAHHFAAGMPHAEVQALNKLTSEEVSGATLYVTLEPCCHWGRTPPCTDLLIERGIKLVVYGSYDPNPLVAGTSAAYLEKANIECIYLPLPEIQTFYRSYFHWRETGQPFVTAKLAMSLDGKIAGAGSTRIQITGSEAQALTHQSRKQHDAILTTAKTIACDNPLLNVRLNNETHKKILYVLDSNLTTSLDAKIFDTTEKITFFCKRNVAKEKLKQFLDKGALCKEVAYKDGVIDLSEVMTYIGQEGIHDLWVEAGSRCFQALVTQHLIHHAFIYIAPKWLGVDAVTAFSDENLFATAKSFAWKSAGNDAICEMFW